MEQALEAIESIIIIAHAKALSDRDGIPHNIKRSVKVHTDTLDELGVPWSIQNNALAFINSRTEQKTWESFYRISKASVARMIMGGKTHDEIITGVAP